MRLVGWANPSEAKVPASFPSTATRIVLLVMSIVMGYHFPVSSLSGKRFFFVASSFPDTQEHFCHTLGILE